MQRKVGHDQAIGLAPPATTSPQAGAVTAPVAARSASRAARRRRPPRASPRAGRRRRRARAARCRPGGRVDPVRLRVDLVTVPRAALATHTAPPATATPRAPGPTSIERVASRSIRHSSPSCGAVTQTAPAPTASPSRSVGGDRNARLAAVRRRHAHDLEPLGRLGQRPGAVAVRGDAGGGEALGRGRRVAVRIDPGEAVVGAEHPQPGAAERDAVEREPRRVVARAAGRTRLPTVALSGASRRRSAGSACRRSACVPVIAQTPLGPCCDVERCAAARGTSAVRTLGIDAGERPVVGVERPGGACARRDAGRRAACGVVAGDRRRSAGRSRRASCPARRRSARRPAPRRRRAATTAAAAAASSSSGGGAGEQRAPRACGRPGARSRARGGSSAGSWRRIASWRSRSAGPGSMPSSSSSARRASWNASSASAWRPAR